MSDNDEATAVHAGGRDDASSPEAIAVPGYRIERRLGEGGMGAVYLAEEIALGRMVAIKVVSDSVARDPEIRARFLREARLLATVEHPNVVRIYTFGTVGDRPYLIMEYVEGETLSERILRCGAMTIDDALQVMREIVDALSAAWEKQVIHRDIKPSNILFDKRGRLKVADFGLAKGVAAAGAESSLTQTGYLLGSPHYVAPEQAQGHDSDFRADIYSLGIVLFEMVTGRKPFEATSALAVVAKHLHDEIPSARGIRKDVPEHLDDVISWMTEKDPARRPSSYDELLASIPAVAATQEMTPPRLSRRKPGRPWLAAVLAIVAVLLGVFLAWQRLAGRETVTARDEGRTVIAVAPFYGPDPESAREGRVMASLVGREIARRMREQVKVLGVEETGGAVRDSDAARALGEKLGATLVIWGDAIKFRGEAEIVPSLTVVPRKNAPKTPTASADPFADFARPPVRVATEAPNQIELRKTSAEGIGELVVLAVSTQLLHEQNDAEGALALLAELRPTADSHHQKAICLMHLRRENAAEAELQRALAMDAKHAGTRSMLAGLAMRDHHYRDAAAHLAAVNGRFTATDGMLYEGKLYAVEQFRDRDREYRAPTMLAIDPEAERVTARYWLPGRPVAFSVDGEDLVIRYDGGQDGAPQIETVRFTHGRFEPPRQLPANPLTRISSVRSMWLIVRDYINDVSMISALKNPNPRFRFSPLPETVLTNDDPKTFAELRATLEKAMEKDPTQPSHRLWLAMTLWELGDHDGAQKNARIAFSDDFPEIPYYHYSWLARQLEGFERRDWADLAYREALRRRKMHPEPVSSTMLIERMVNAPFTRGAAVRSRWAPDPPRHFEWVVRTRELSGVEPVVDSAISAAWQRYFETKGDAASTARARELARLVSGPNPMVWAVMVDLLFVAIGSVALTLLALLVGVSVRALHGAGWSVMRASAGVSRGSRTGVIFLCALLIALTIAQARVARKVAAASALPAGTSDSLGSAPMIVALEKKLPDQPELTFATAVANHLGGRARRARELYLTVSGDAAAENRNDLKENRPPRHIPPSAEVRDLAMRVPLSQTLADLTSAWTASRVSHDEDPWAFRELRFSTLAGLTLVLLIAFCAWIAIARPDRVERPLTPLSIALGVVALCVLGGTMLSYRAGVKAANGVPCPGPITAGFQPPFDVISPLPPMPTYDAAVLWTATHTAPFRIFYGFVIAAALLAVAFLVPPLVHAVRTRLARRAGL